MSESAWRRLAKKLKEEGHQSEHLKRLEANLSIEERQELLEKEIYQEMAGALGRAGMKVDVALLELELAGREVDKAPDEATKTEKIEDYNALRRRALVPWNRGLLQKSRVDFRWLVTTRGAERIEPIRDAERPKGGRRPRRHQTRKAAASFARNFGSWGLELLHELRIHREAIGLRRHEVLVSMYPIPPKR
jgi:hypothetical protein